MLVTLGRTSTLAIGRIRPRAVIERYEYRTFSELTGQHLMNVARLCSRRRGSHWITSSAQPLAILCAVRGCYFADLYRRLNRAPEAEMAYRKALSMSQQERERRYLTLAWPSFNNNNFRALSKSGFAKRLRE